MKRANILLGSIWAALLVLAAWTGGTSTAAAQEAAPILKVEKSPLTLEAVAPKLPLQRATPLRTAFSHDGKWVAYHLGMDLEVLDLQDRRLVPVMNSRIFTDVQTADKGKATRFVGVREFTWTLQNEPWNQDPMRMLTVEVKYQVQGRDYTVQMSTLADGSFSGSMTNK